MTNCQCRLLPRVGPALGQSSIPGSRRACFDAGQGLGVGGVRHRRCLRASFRTAVHRAFPCHKDEDGPGACAASVSAIATATAPRDTARRLNAGMTTAAVRERDRDRTPGAARGRPPRTTVPWISLRSDTKTRPTPSRAASDSPATMMPTGVPWRLFRRGASRAAGAVAALDVVDHELLECCDTVGPRKVTAFLPSMNTGAAGASPVPGSEMPMSACLDSPGPLTMQPITATFKPSTPG